VRLAAPPVEPPASHHSLIQTLFPVVGSVGLLGFALLYHNRTFLYIALAMVFLMLVFSVAMRFSQRRGVRKKAAADARRYAIQRLQELVGLLVLDCGTGLGEPAARAAQLTADQIILVSDANPSTASLVAEAAELLRTAGPPLTLVINKMPGSSRDTRIDVEGLARLVRDAHGLVVLADDPAGAARVAAGEFTWDDAPATWRRSVRELAAVLAADWPALGVSG